jgi:hypothetical protein
MAAALVRHDALAAATIQEHEGALVKHRGEGDSLFAVFARAVDAVAAAVALQQALQDFGFSILDFGLEVSPRSVAPKEHHSIAQISELVCQGVATGSGVK